MLIVEDHTDTARLLGRLVEQHGHRAVIAHRAQAALALAKHSRFDMLLCDIQLPDGDGWSLLEEIRKLYPIAAIACTGKSLEQDIARSIDAGFHAHLVKPIRWHDLIQRIDQETEQGNAREFATD
jgi:CheY-like chemotaxis protein